MGRPVLLTAPASNAAASPRGLLLIDPKGSPAMAEIDTNSQSRKQANCTRSAKPCTRRSRRRRRWAARSRSWALRWAACLAVRRRGVAGDRDGRGRPVARRCRRGTSRATPTPTARSSATRPGQRGCWRGRTFPREAISAWCWWTTPGRAFRRPGKAGSGAGRRGSARLLRAPRKKAGIASRTPVAPAVQHSNTGAVPWLIR